MTKVPRMHFGKVFQNDVGGTEHQKVAFREVSEIIGAIGAPPS